MNITNIPIEKIYSSLVEIWSMKKQFSRVEIVKLPKPRSKNVSKLSDSFFYWEKLRFINK